MKALVKNLKIIKNSKGNITKILNKNDNFFSSLGEVYLSKTNKGSIKAWKKHKKINVNLVVISGAIKFVIYNESNKKFSEFILKEQVKKRIFIPAGLWFGFKGLSNTNIILSITSKIFNKHEILRKKVKDIKFKW